MRKLLIAGVLFAASAAWGAAEKVALPPDLQAKIALEVKAACSVDLEIKDSVIQRDRSFPTSAVVLDTYEGVLPIRYVDCGHPISCYLSFKAEGVGFSPDGPMAYRVKEVESTPCSFGR
jgi:hypothetical protein